MHATIITHPQTRLCATKTDSISYNMCKNREKAQGEVTQKLFLLYD